MNTDKWISFLIQSFSSYDKLYVSRHQYFMLQNVFMNRSKNVVRFSEFLNLSVLIFILQAS